MQFVFSLTEHLFHRNGITDKHIVRLQQQCTVEINVRIRVKPFKSHHGSFPRKLFFRHGKRSLVFPVLILHPLNILLIRPERVGKQLVIQQILMHSSRYSGRPPFIGARLRKHPSLIQHQYFGSIISLSIP